MFGNLLLKSSLCSETAVKQSETSKRFSEEKPQKPRRHKMLLQPYKMSI